MESYLAPGLLALSGMEGIHCTHTAEHKYMTDKIHPYPVNGILDLHEFHPRDAADVTREYLRACHLEGIYRVRVIHGKGKGVLRRTVHKVLADFPLVEHWKTATDASSWGATLVDLKPPPDSKHA